jgi:uncharacterized membrane protein YozB (DUF420 family)
MGTLQLCPGMPINQSEPMNQPARSGRWEMIRYSLCVLISVIALAFALDNLVWFALRLGWNIRFATVNNHWTFWRISAPGFFSLAVAVIAWRFRKKS